MSRNSINRREFMTAGAAGAVVAGIAEAQTKPAAKAKSAAPAKAPSRQSILNYNENMEYRPLGKTGLMVSAISLGGHWKRIGTVIGNDVAPKRYADNDWTYLKLPGFMEARDRVLSHCIEVGINYLDAMAAPEVVAYGQLLKGRRDKMYFGYGWWPKEPRFPEWRDAKKLLTGLDENLKQAGLDYIDLWRITLPMEGVPDLGELQRVEDATLEGLTRAKKQGKTRFTGVSTHNRVWLKALIEQYPDVIQVAIFPYTAASKELPTDSLFDTIKEYNVGTFGIKPFADNSLFVGDGSLNHAAAANDDRRARLALRYILGNPAITAPIPGLINNHQVDNAVQAVRERRELDLKEKAELDQAGREMWARLRPGYEWLRDWEYV
jgi:uncharacterized protein